MSSYSLNEFMICKSQLLGKGATGQVYLGKQLKEKVDVAVKIIDLKTIDNEVTKYLLSMQKKALMSVVNPYVLRGITIVQNSQFCYLITQLCNGGSLKAEIKTKGPFTEAKSLKYLTQILKGQCGLIGKGIIHRDLKPANILLHNGQAKIIDFGYCEMRGQAKPSLQYNVGSPSYMSPEAFKYNQYSQKSQIWAVGVTFYECLNGKTFDDGRNMGQVFKEIKKKGIPFRVEVSDKSKYLIEWCLQSEPKKRPTCLELLNFIVSAEKTLPPSSSKKTIQIIPLNNFGDLPSQTVNKQAPKSRPQLVVMNDLVNKEDILKSYQNFNKIKQSTSTFEPNQYLPQKKQAFQSTPYQMPYTSKNKYNTQVVNKADVKPLVFKRTSFNSQAENTPSIYFSSRQNSRQNPIPFNISRQKVPRASQHNHRKSPSINLDYFGFNSQRF